MYPPIPNAFTHGHAILAGLCCEVPRLLGSAQVSGPAKFTARGTTSQNTWAPGLDNLGPNQGPDPLGPHGGESRIESGSTPGTHFSLLHSPGLLSVGAFLLLLPLPVPHNLAPSVTLSRISSSLPRHDSHERSPSIPTAPNSFVTTARSDPDASRHHVVPKRLVHGNSARDSAGSRGEANAKPKPHSPVLSADSRSLFISIAFSTQHSIHHSETTLFSGRKSLEDRQKQFLIKLLDKETLSMLSRRAAPTTATIPHHVTVQSTDRLQ